MIKQIKENPAVVLMSLCEIVVGVLLLVDPIRFTSGIIAALGVLLTLLGALSVVRYFMTEARQAAKERRFAKGLFLLCSGLFCMLRNDWFIATFPALTSLYGAGLLLVGFVKVQRAVDLLRMKRGIWFTAAIGAGISLLAAVLILINPFQSALVLWILIGAALLLDAASDLLSIFLKKKPAKGAGEA